MVRTCIVQQVQRARERRKPSTSQNRSLMMTKTVHRCTRWLRVHTAIPSLQGPHCHASLRYSGYGGGVPRTKFSAHVTQPGPLSRMVYTSRTVCWWLIHPGSLIHAPVVGVYSARYPGVKVQGGCLLFALFMPRRSTGMLFRVRGLLFI